MARRIPEVDAYIADAAPFAQPILKKLRTLFHKASPEIREEIKWGVPHFVREGIIGGMAAFKQHVSFGLWRSKELPDPDNLFGGNAKASMCNVKVAEKAELPDDAVWIEYVRAAVARDSESGAGKKQKKARAAGSKKAAIPVPADFAAALAKSRKAAAHFDAFPPGKRRDYLEWITTAKKAETRARRIETAVEWIAEGKGKNWKYENC